MNQTQERIIEFVSNNKRVGRTPTMRQIANYTGRSVSTIHEAIVRLEQKGVLQRHYTANSPKRSGSITLTNSGNMGYRERAGTNE